VDRCYFRWIVRVWNWVPYSIHEVTHLRTWQEEGVEGGSLKEVFDVYSLTEDVRVVGRIKKG